ncbi:hypothetical protein B0A54_07552 [Friedmanniomyces endolithicus]|uniref:Cupin type-2 domain-containing protein n=1 Tax=Friedmanniomyces endolithicus TaxID=329885 RepID=A0A4V5NA77_9PEZI|nr:hypothetical protein B0A54_07552 [Friedmanniomyces endolithicus]
MTDKLPTIARFVTTHNAEGKAVFTDAVGEAAEKKPIDGGRVVFGLQYCSEEFPVDLNNHKDLDAYQRYQGEPPGLVISSGTVLRTVGELNITRPSISRADNASDMEAGHVSPMHRTVSLDYGIVLEGEVELILDSGEKRAMKRGDVAIQRGTCHAWRNMSDTEPARMIYVLMPSKPLEVAGQRLGEDLETMVGVRNST